MMMRYPIIIEKANGNFSAYVPDLPGCVPTSDTEAQVESLIREVVERAEAPAAFVRVREAVLAAAGMR